MDCIILDVVAPTAADGTEIATTAHWVAAAEVRAIVESAATAVVASSEVRADIVVSSKVTESRVSEISVVIVATAADRAKVADTTRGYEVSAVIETSSTIAAKIGAAIVAEIINATWRIEVVATVETTAAVVVAAEVSASIIAEVSKVSAVTTVVSKVAGISTVVAATKVAEIAGSRVISKISIISTLVVSKVARVHQAWQIVEAQHVVGTNAKVAIVAPIFV